MTGEGRDGELLAEGHRDNERQLGVQSGPGLGGRQPSLPGGNIH